MATGDQAYSTTTNYLDMTHRSSNKKQKDSLVPPPIESEAGTRRDKGNVPPSRPGVSICPAGEEGNSQARDPDLASDSRIRLLPRSAMEIE